MVTIPPLDEEEEREEGSEGEGGEVEGDMGGTRAPHRTFVWERPEEGRLQDGTWGFYFSWRSLVLFSVVLPFVFSFSREGIGEKGKGLPHLVGRTPHLFAGKCRLGTGLGRRMKADKASSCHSSFGLDAAV